MFRKPFRVKSQTAMKGSDRFDDYSGVWTIRTSDYSYPGLFVLWVDYSYLGRFVRWSRMDYSYIGLFVRWTFRTTDYSYYGLFVPFTNIIYEDKFFWAALWTWVLR